MATSSENYCFKDDQTKRFIRYVTVDSLRRPKQAVKAVVHAGVGVAGVAPSVQYTTADIFRKDFADFIGEIAPSMLEGGKDEERFNRLDEYFENFTREVRHRQAHEKKAAQQQLDSCILAVATAVLVRAQNPHWFAQDYLLVFHLVEVILRPFCPGEPGRANLKVSTKITNRIGSSYAAPVFVELTKVLSDDDPARPIKLMVSRCLTSLCFLCYSCMHLFSYRC
jgi:hypothetical protein